MVEPTIKRKRVRHNVNGRLRFETVFILCVILFIFFCFSPSYDKSDRKKYELEISTLDIIFAGQK